MTAIFDRRLLTWICYLHNSFFEGAFLFGEFEGDFLERLLALLGFENLIHSEKGILQSLFPVLRLEGWRVQKHLFETPFAKLRDLYTSMSVEDPE